MRAYPKQPPRYVDPRDPDHEPREPAEPVMADRDRPAARDCEVCGEPFRPAPADAADVVCTWCTFHADAAGLDLAA